MKIYFCDVCNESIPLEELASGATTIKDKIICSSCLPKAAPGAGAAGASRGASILAMIAIAIGIAAVAHSFLVNRSVEAIPDTSTEIAELRTMLTTATQGIETLRSGQEELRRAIGQIRSKADNLQSNLGDESRRVDQIEQAQMQMRAVVENQGADREALHDLVLGHSKAELSIRELREAILTLEGRVAELSSGPMIGGLSDEGSPSESPAAEFDEETRRYLADLSNRDSSVRWTAVDHLASMRNVALITHLIPLIEDSDTFVQFRVIQALRELNARSAVEKLIGLLRDGDPIVREEALEALVSLTGHADRFDVTNAPPEDRETGVRRWEGWFKENRERFVEEL
jgi:HEAT repeat protein